MNICVFEGQYVVSCEYFPCKTPSPVVHILLVCLVSLLGVTGLTNVTDFSFLSLAQAGCGNSLTVLHLEGPISPFALGFAVVRPSDISLLWMTNDSPPQCYLK